MLNSSEIVDAEARRDLGRDFSRKAFRAGCYAPFTSLFFDTHGNVLPCCKSWEDPLGNVEQDSLDDIWRGARVNALRKLLIDYKFERSCEFCGWQMEVGEFQGSFASVFERFPVETLIPEWPRQLQFAGRPTCNLECIMCNGELSSRIRRRREHRAPARNPYGDKFFNDLRKYLPHLEYMEFFGGEPFLTRECFRIWDMMIEDGLSTRCHVSTNGTLYNSRVERVLGKLPFSITVSVDGATKETVEKVRYGADYYEIMKNIVIFKNYTDRVGTSVTLSYCLMRQNWTEFFDFLILAEELGCSVFVNTVINPDECSLFSLPPSELLEIVESMEIMGKDASKYLKRNHWCWLQQMKTLRGHAIKALDV